MPIPDAFSIVALTASITANLATDILKHHAHTLENTVVGKMLKWAGLVKPDFDDHLREALSEALQLYFQTYPQYAIVGITNFFQDPATAKQIGNYILNRDAIDHQEIQRSLDRHLGNSFLTKSLMQQRGLSSERIVPDFLECYQQVLVSHSNIPHVAVLLEVVTQTEKVIAEIKSSEERLRSIAHKIKSSLDSHSELLEHIVTDLGDIKKHLGLDRPQQDIEQEIKLAINSSPRGPMFQPGGLCSGYPLQVLPDSYFVAQEFNLNRNDLRNALTDSLKTMGVRPICADDSLLQGHILCKISALIQSTPFGAYQLTVSQNRNVYLELGIAIGLRRPFVLIKDKGATLSSLAQGLDYYSIDSYLEMRYELKDKISPFFANIANYQPISLPSAGSLNTVVISHGDLEVIDFCVPLARIVKEHNMTPAILGDPTGKLSRYLNLEGVTYQIIGEAGQIQLNETVAVIQAARMGVYRIDKTAIADNFLALGVSVGLNRPGILVHKKDNDLPSDLKGLSAIGFNSFTELEPPLHKQIDQLLRHYR